MENSRSILPAIYNSNLVKYDWMPPNHFADENVCNRIAHVKLENEVERLHAENQRILNERIGVIDLDPNELEDLQEIVLNDEIEFVSVMPLPIRFKEEPTYDDAIEQIPNNNEPHTDDINDETREVMNSNVLMNETNGENGVNLDFLLDIDTGSSTANGNQACQSIHDPVAGFINVVVDVIHSIFIHYDSS